jgi:hypothetical protein
MEIPLPEEQFRRMLDTTWKIGLMQHSRGKKPDPKHGSSIDDNARALIVAAREPWLDKFNNYRQDYLNFVLDAQRSDGTYFNYKNSNGKWSERDIGADCLGRATWALAEFVNCDRIYKGFRKPVEERFLANAEIAPQMADSPMSSALSLIGLSKYLDKNRNDMVERSTEELADKLMAYFDGVSEDGWVWPGEKVTYCVGRIPQALILAGDVLERDDLLNRGKACLDFVIENSFEDDVFLPIGNDGWFKKGGKPARYDQQTIEAGTVVEACVDAFDRTKNPIYLERANQAFYWFSGHNSEHKPVLAPNGGVCDALKEGSVNANQGAESVLSYLLANGKMREAVM